MVKIDLITGFLGSGKTTFMKKYAKYLMDRGENIGILENDYGAVNVDMMLLQELRGDRCELEMVAGGCDAHCHRRRFKTKLISMGMCGYDRVLIEPSGIFDVDEFFDALYEEPLCNWYEIGNVIAIVDAALEEDLPEAAEYLLASQIACAGRVVLSRCQEANAEELAATRLHLNRAMEAVHCRRRFGDDVFCKDWDALTPPDFEMLLSCGYRPEDFVKAFGEEDNGYSSLYFMHVRIPKERIRETLRGIMQDESAGHIFRIKGFMRDGDGWIEINATRRQITVKPIEKGQEIVIVIGENLKEDKLRLHLEKLGYI